MLITPPAVGHSQRCLPKHADEQQHEDRQAESAPVDKSARGGEETCRRNYAADHKHSEVAGETLRVGGAQLLIKDGGSFSSGGDLLSSHVAGAVSGDEFSQVVAVVAIAAKGLGVEQSLDATVGTDSIGIVIIVPRRSTHVGVPAPAEQNCRGCAYSRSSNAERPSPAPKSPARHVESSEPSPAFLPSLNCMRRPTTIILEITGTCRAPGGVGHYLGLHVHGLEGTVSPPIR